MTSRVIKQSHFSKGICKILEFVIGVDVQIAESVMIDILDHLFHLVGQADQIDLRPPAGRAGNDLDPLSPKAQCTEDLLRDPDFFRGISGQRHTDRVAVAFRQEQSQSDRGSHGARQYRSRLGNAEMKRIYEKIVKSWIEIYGEEHVDAWLSEIDGGDGDK